MKALANTSEKESHYKILNQAIFDTIKYNKNVTPNKNVVQQRQIHIFTDSHIHRFTSWKKIKYETTVRLQKTTFLKQHNLKTMQSC